MNPTRTLGKGQGSDPVRLQPKVQTYFIDRHGDLGLSADTRTPIEKVLAVLPDAREVGRNQWAANCPCANCNDTGEHLSITEAADGTILLHCFRDCTFSEIVAAMGLQERDFFRSQQRHPSKHGKIKTPPKGAKHRTPAKHTEKKSAVKKKGRTTASLRTAPGANRDWAALVQQYEAALPKDKLVKVARLLGVTRESLKQLHIGWQSDTNRFTFAEFDGTGDVVGIGTRAHNGEKKVVLGSKRGIYIPQHWDTYQGTILIIEGPSDTAALITMGVAGLGRPCATGGVEHLAELLADVPESREIIVVGELDEKASGKWPGRDGAISVAEKLAAKLGRDVSWALPPDGAKDVRAWLLAQKRSVMANQTDLRPLGRQLLTHIGQVKCEVTPKEDNQGTSPKVILEAFGIEILGETDDQAILCWIEHTRKRWKVKSPARWPDNEILQAIGSVGARQLRFTENDEDHRPEGTYTPDELRHAVALEAAEATRITPRDLLGQGVWKHGNRFLIVNGAAAHLYDGVAFRRVKRPKLGRHIIDFDAGRAWAKNIRPMVQAMTAARAMEIFVRLLRLMENWNWTHSQDAVVATALVLATFIQACWTWRPLVSITGASDSGKSTLMDDLLVSVLGAWSIAADRSTEAGLRQAIGHHAMPVLIDEFDKYKQRQQVLELFRTASRGGKILRGTQDQSGQEFGVRHLAWFSAIESGDIWGQDRNRFIRLELRPPTNRGNLCLPGPSELAQLGQELAAVAFWAAPAAVTLADRIKSVRIAGVHGRLIESFAVPAAMLAVTWHGRDATQKQGESILKTMIQGRTTLANQGEKDEVQLLRDILAANLRVTVSQGSSSSSQERAVGQLLEEHKHRESLEAKGLKIIEPRGELGQRLFLVDDVVRRELLRGTRWAESRIDQLLERLPDAKREQQRCAGQRPWGITIPWPPCLGGLGGGNTGQDTQNMAK